MKDYLFGLIGFVTGALLVGSVSVYTISDSHFDKAVLKPKKEIKVVASTRVKEEPIEVKIVEEKLPVIQSPVVAKNKNKLPIVTVKLDDGTEIERIYDIENNVICYRSTPYSAFSSVNQALSCLKDK